MRFIQLSGMVLLAFSTLAACSSLKSGTSSKTEKFNTYLDKKFDERVERYPQHMTYLGIKKDYDKLDEYTEEKSAEELQISKTDLKDLTSKWNPSDLDRVGAVSYELAKKSLEEDISDYEFRHHNYPVNQMFGTHSNLPSFMINFHRVDNLSDAKAYVSRIKESQRLMNEVIAQLKIREEKGIILPKFLFSKIYSDIDNLLSGFPLDKSKTPHSLKEDFTKKVAELKIEEVEKEQLQKDFDEALQTYFKPGYESLKAYMKTLEKKADNRAGVWKFPKGDEYYQLRLKRYTTTDMTPEAIHQLGLKETERIHGEMREIMKKVGFKGNLKAFFKKMQTDKQFYYPSTQAGRDQYLKDTVVIIENMKKRLPELFSIFPKADVKVKPVEPFREKTAGLAFYTGPAPDGSRPGIYYVNLYDLSAVPKYEMEALAYHEAIPGHHMQIAIAQELPNLPKFRRFGGYTAYSEGWGLYAESIPKDIGLYQDPYSDFGRLSMELWRAARLVVDTGLHHKRWSREQAAQWLNENTPGNRVDNLKAIDRYIVMPGQATTYKIGMLKIQELRDKAQKALGDKFDIRRYHDEVLRHGAVPLDVLEELIEEWILREKSIKLAV